MIDTGVERMTVREWLEQFEVAEGSPPSLEEALFRRLNPQDDEALVFIMAGGLEAAFGKVNRSVRWNVAVDLDDYAIVFFRDGEPVAAFYLSSRGSAYQAEAHIVEGNVHLFADNFRNEDTSATWVEESAGYASIAVGFIGLAREIVV